MSGVDTHTDCGLNTITEVIVLLPVRRHASTAGLKPHFANRSPGLTSGVRLGRGSCNSTLLTSFWNLGARHHVRRTWGAILSVSTGGER